MSGQGNGKGWGIANLLGNIGTGLFNWWMAERDAEKARQWQYKTMKEQQSWMTDMMYRQNALTRENQQLSWLKYDSPAAQRGSLEAAGINPFVEGSAVSTGVSSYNPAGNGMQSPSGLDPVKPSDRKYDAMTQVSQSIGQSAKLIADLGLVKAQTRKLNADAEGQENSNSVFDRDTEVTIRQSFKRQEVAKAMISEINAAYAEMKEIDDMSQRAAIWEKTMAEIDEIGTRAGVNRETIDNLKKEGQKKLAEKGYLEELTTDLQETREGRKRNMAADSALKEAKARFEDAAREHNVEKVKQEVALIKEKVAEAKAAYDLRYGKGDKTYGNLSSLEAGYKYYQKQMAHLDALLKAETFDADALIKTMEAVYSFIPKLGIKLK